MAIQTRYAGDAQVVVNVGTDQTRNANAIIINTGIASPVSTYKVTFPAGAASGAANLAAELDTGGAVETILRTLQANATVVMYQIDAGTSGAQQISILAERSAMSAADFQTIVRTLGNIGSTANVYAGPGVTVTSSGFKLA